MPRALWLAVAAVLLGVWLVDPVWTLHACGCIPVGRAGTLANRRQAASLTTVVKAPSVRDPP